MVLLFIYLLFTSAFNYTCFQILFFNLPLIFVHFYKTVCYLWMDYGVNVLGRYRDGLMD